MALVKLNATLGLTGTLPAVSGANLTGIASDFVKISTTNITSDVASVSITGIDNTYPNYKIIASEMCQTNTGSNLQFRFINGSGEMTSSHYWGAHGGAYRPYNSAHGAVLGSVHDTNYGQITNFNGSTNLSYGTAFEMILPNPSNASTHPACYGNCFTDADNGTYVVTSTFAYKHRNANSIVSGIKFMMASNNLKQGKLTLYGIKG
nr:hypothetical protein [uncultured Mediterranean phage uvMED]